MLDPGTRQHWEVRRIFIPRILECIAVLRPMHVGQVKVRPGKKSEDASMQGYILFFLCVELCCKNVGRSR